MPDRKDVMNRIEQARKMIETRDDQRYMDIFLLDVLRDALAMIQHQKKPYESVKKLPCTCGRKNLETWTGLGKDGHVVESFKCPNCGRKTGRYRTHRELVEAWNRMVSGDA